MCAERIITIRFRRKESCREKRNQRKEMGPSIGYLRMQTVRAFGYMPMMTTQKVGCYQEPPQAILLTLPDMRPGQWARPG